MKTKVLAVLFGGLLATAGCVGTVTGGKTGGVPFVKDTFESAYRLPPEVIFTAAKEVIRADGVLVNEGINYSQTNAMKVVEGRVNQRKVWISITPANAQVTTVAVQTRTSAGGPDLTLANQIDKEIAIKLASRPRP